MKSPYPLPQVMILGTFPFPDGSAASSILRGHARAIQSAGLSVGLLADQKNGRDEDKRPDGHFAYRGIDYWAVQRTHAKPLLHRLLNSLMAWQDDRLAWLAKQQPLAGVKAILVYPGVSRTVPLLLRLRRLCRRKGIKLIVYGVEWHEPGHNGVRPFAFATADGEVQRRWINHRLDGVLCISDYLQAYYRAKGVRTALIPPLLDLSDPIYTPELVSPQQEDAGAVRVLFSGTPGRDRQDLILRAVQEARRQGADVVLEYLGCTRDAIVAMRGVGEELLEQVGEGVRFHGRVPYHAVVRITAAASFGLLFREDSKWSKACFPSKVPEFFALGLPVLCNLTSDLHRYLKEGHNAMIVHEMSVEGLASVLRCAAALESDHYHRMKAAARATAQLFDGRSYGKAYRELLEGK
jgi:glycosyltransferase involved in cell wall biosynthesis